MNLWLMAGAVLALNVPFGYWRANASRFSLPWFLSIHVPVAFVIAFRSLGGLGWQPVTFPALVGAFFFGQLLGMRAYSYLRRRRPPTPERISAEGIGSEEDL